MAKTTGTLKQAALASAKRESGKSKTLPSTLSEEVVVESSSDADSDSDSEIDEHDEQTAELVAKQTNGAKPAKAATKAAPESEESSDESSEESSGDSDDEDESEQSPSPTKVTAPAKVNGVKRKPSIEDVPMSDAESDHKSKKAKVATQSSAASSTQPAINHALPVQPYEAPRGYKKAHISEGGNLSQADLKNKVVWHISAPPDVPLRSLSRISQATIDARKPVLTHKGIDYILVETEPVQSAILLPGAQGYKSAGKTVSKTYSLRPAFTLPTIPALAASRNAGSAVAANIATAAVTTIRPQPKGLKMRYRPPGFGGGKLGRIGDSSDEEENEESIYQFPKAVGPSTDGDGTMLGDGVAKKKKKEKKSKHDKSNGIAHDNEARPAPAAEHNSNVDADEARRKAEKKRRRLPSGKH